LKLVIPIKINAVLLKKLVCQIVNKFAAKSEMMENKTVIRKMDLGRLSKEHHAGRLFCWKLRQGIKYHIETDRMKKFVKYFWAHFFSGHFKEEEEILFASVKDQEVQKALEDHRKIKFFVDKIKISGKGNEQKVMLDLADTLDDHILFEERILFPHLQKKLSDDQLEKIEMQLVQKPFVDKYKDEFWVKSKSL
jgi:hemerythrin-like domain-containing protein